MIGYPHLKRLSVDPISVYQSGEVVALSQCSSYLILRPAKLSSDGPSQQEQLIVKVAEGTGVAKCLTRLISNLMPYGGLT